METVQDRTYVLLITNRKSHMSFRLVPKSVTLNGVMAVIVPHSVAFGADHVKVVEDTPIYTDTFCDRTVAQKI